MGVTLSFSHQAELLADCLIERLRTERRSAPSLLYRPYVIVPSINVQRWLQLRLVEQYGIASPLQFFQLEQGLVHLSTCYSSDKQEGQRETEPIPTNPSGGNALTLALLYELVPLLSQDLPAENPLQPLVQSVATSGSPEEQARRLWGTCQTLAQLFREYAFHRLPMLLAWLRGETWLLAKCGAHWHAQERLQCALFQRIIQAHAEESATAPAPAPLDHALALVAMARRWQARDQAQRSFPTTPNQPVHIFGFSLISTLHRLWIERLGLHTTLHLYQINACAEFWEDMETSSELLHRRARSIAIVEDQEGEYLSPASFENRLLQSFGKAGREATKLFSELADISLERLEESAPSPTLSLLNALQRQIIGRTNSSERIPADSSLRIVRCSSPMAEVEAVHADIARALGDDPTLMLGQIAVFAPDLATYAPLFRLVFGSRAPQLPFALLDARIDDASSFAHFIKLFLRLAAGEITRQTIIDILGNACAQNAAQLSEHFDSGACREWFLELGFYEGAGFDEHAQGQVLPRSLAQALVRNRIGRIMAIPHSYDQGEPVLELRDDVHGLVPYSSLFGRSEDTAAASHYLEALLSYLKGANVHEQTFAAWLEWLRTGIDLFGMPTDQNQREQHVVRDLFERLNALLSVPFPNMLRGSKAPEISLALFSEIVLGTFAEQRAGYGSFLQGGLIIGSLRPLRPIPFRRIFVVGLGETSFPGSSQHNSLDIRQAYRCIGDVSSSELNSYLFLETLLSTRDALWLSYVDRDVERDLPLAPSVVLTELQDHLEKNLLAPGEQPLREPTEPPAAPVAQVSRLPRASEHLATQPEDILGISFPRTLRISTLRAFLQNPLAVGLTTIARTSSRLEKLDSGGVPLYEDGVRRSDTIMRGLQAGLCTSGDPSAIDNALIAASAYFARRSLAPPRELVQRDIIDQKNLIFLACSELLDRFPPSLWEFRTGYTLGAPFRGNIPIPTLAHTGTSPLWLPPARIFGHFSLEDCIPPHFIHRDTGDIALLYTTWRSPEAYQSKNAAPPDAAAIDAFLLGVALQSTTIESSSPIAPFAKGITTGSTTVLTVNVMRDSTIGVQRLGLQPAVAQSYAELLAAALTPRNCFEALPMKCIYNDEELSSLLFNASACDQAQATLFQNRLRSVYATEYPPKDATALKAQREDLLRDLPQRVPRDALRKARDRYLPLHAAYREGITSP